MNAVTPGKRWHKREPVRAFATTPAVILGVATAVEAFGVGSPSAALIIAAILVVACALLEIVRSKVTPAG